MQTEVTRVVLVAPLAIGLLLYWTAIVYYFRRRARRDLDRAVAIGSASSPSSDLLIDVRLPIGRVVGALLLPIVLLLALLALR
jgi:hypothetical protein